MKLLNKISTYSLVTAGLAFTLTTLPATSVQAQVFRIGQTTARTNGGLSPDITAANFRGQSFTLNVVGGGTGGTVLSAPARTKATLQRITFAYSAAPSGSVTAFLYRLADIPTLANIGTGNVIAQTSAVIDDTTGKTDGSVFGTDSAPTTIFSRTFDFTGATFNNTLAPNGELDTTTEYVVLLNANQSVFGRRNEQLYTGGVAYRNVTSALTAPGTFATTLQDSAFFVEATAVPFEFEATGGVAILGGLFLANKLRKRNQKSEIDDQA